MKNRNSIFNLQTVHPDVVDKIIANMKGSKSCGLDDIDASIIKLARVDLVPAITHIVNLSIIQKSFPVAWKSAKIIPLHKKNDMTDPKNYRPVALLSVLSLRYWKELFFNK